MFFFIFWLETMFNETKLSIIKGDITKLKVDAIVNAGETKQYQFIGLNSF